MRKTKKDYADRKGVTQEPMVEEDLEQVSPLHCLMRSFCFCKLLGYHLRSETYQWTESPLKMGRAYIFFTDSIQEIKDEIYYITGITMDTADSSGTGGNTDKGDVCQQILTTYRHYYIS